MTRAPKFWRVVGGARRRLARCSPPAEAPRASASKVTITLYNGQHVQTTDALVSAFEKANPSIDVAVRSDDEDTFDAEIVQEGSRSPADVFYTENSPALEYLQQRGLLAKVDAVDARQTPAKYNSPKGDWVGVSARVSVLIYNPSLIKKSQLPTHVLQLANPKYKGKLAFAAGETDFQPIVTSVIRAYGKAARADVAERHQGQRGQPHLPRQRDDHLRRQPRHCRLRTHQSVLLVPTEGRDRRVEHALEDRLLSRRAIPGTSSTCRARRSSSPRSIKRPPRSLSRSSSPRRARRSSLIRSASSTRSPRVSRRPQPETPFQDLEPYPINIARLGTGVGGHRALA